MATVLNLRDRALESRDAIELVANKWRIAVLHLLTPGPLRTRDLQRGLVDVSPKMLTQTLRSMERDGLIERTVFAAVPPRVEYRLSQMGRSLLGPLRDLCLWARANHTARDEARRLYDRDNRAPHAGSAGRRTARTGGASTTAGE